MYGKYYLYKQQVSYDGGVNWYDTGYEQTSGDPISIYETNADCIGNVMYRWDYRTSCIGLDDYKIKVKQFSSDSGATWEDVLPIKKEYLEAETLNSTGCGYTWQVYENLINDCFTNYPYLLDGSQNYWETTCFETSPYEVDKINAFINDSGQSFGILISLGKNISVPFSGYNFCGIEQYGMGSGHTWAGNSFSVKNDKKVISGYTKIIIGYGNTSVHSVVSLWTDNLEEIVIPKTVTNIPSAFVSTYLKKVVMLGVTPPTITESAFTRTDILTIYVPPEAVNTYKSASGWSNYADCIVAFGEEKTAPQTYKVKITDVYGNEYYIPYDGNNILTYNNTDIFSNKCQYYPLGGLYPKAKIREIQIGTGVTSLGEYSIGNKSGYYGPYNVFDNLTGFTIPNTITSIDFAAFRNAGMLKNIVVPSSVTSIGDAAFMNCSNLSAITIPNTINEIKSWMFAGAVKLKRLNNSDSDVVNITSNFSKINNRAFQSCHSITNLNISDSVKIIGEEAFIDCTGITNVNIGTGVTDIAGESFSRCTSLSSITINALTDDINWFGCDVFSACTNLPTVDEIRYADWYVVEATNKGKSSYTLQNSTKWIGRNAFVGCTGTTAVTIPEGVKRISYAAFSGCTNLSSINIPSSVNFIEDCVFDNCNSLPIENNIRYADTYAVGVINNSIRTTIKDGTKWIGDYFIGPDEEHPNIREINIPDSVIGFGQFAFVKCRNLTTLRIPSGTTYIGSYAFWGCGASNFGDLVLPSTLRYIGDSSFYRTNVTSLVIPDSTYFIGQYAFGGTSITSLTIGNGIEEIGVGAFAICSNLTSITIERMTPPELGNDVFDDTNNCPIYVPAESVNIYKSADGWSTYASRIQAIP